MKNLLPHCHVGLGKKTRASFPQLLARPHACARELKPRWRADEEKLRGACFNMIQPAKVERFVPFGREYCSHHPFCSESFPNSEDGGEENTKQAQTVQYENMSAWNALIWWISCHILSWGSLWPHWLEVGQMCPCSLLGSQKFNTLAHLIFMLIWLPYMLWHVEMYRWSRT